MTTDLVTKQGYPLKLSDAGRATSSHPKETNDCMVRSLVHVSGLRYDVCWELCRALAKRRYRQGGDDAWYNEPGWFVVPNPKYGKGPRPVWADTITKSYVFQKYSFPATTGERRMTPQAFCKAFPEGRFILSETEHVEACLDGIIHDDRWQVETGKMKLQSFRVVYNAYQLHEVPPLHSIWTAYRYRPGKKRIRLGPVYGRFEQEALELAAKWYEHVVQGNESYVVVEPHNKSIIQLPIGRMSFRGLKVDDDL